MALRSLRAGGALGALRALDTLETLEALSTLATLRTLATGTASFALVERLCRLVAPLAAAKQLVVTYMPCDPALAALASPRTRPIAALLWAQLVSWLALVAMNGQVRWQNERYTMAAVAWSMMVPLLPLLCMWVLR